MGDAKDQFTFTRKGNEIFRSDGQVCAIVMSAAEGDLILNRLNATLPNPTPDVADLVKRLTDYAVSDHSRGCQGRCYECTCGYDAKRDPLLDEAAAMLTLLQAQVAVARQMGIEEAIAAQPSTAENPNEDAYQRGRFDGIMDYGRAIVGLSPALDMDALVEKGMQGIRCIDREYARNVARAVLSALGVGRGE
jgi:hypothetical protein